MTVPDWMKPDFLVLDRADADRHVARWHSSDSNEPLHEYLGLTWDEYALWTENPESLRLILAAHE